MRDRLRTQSYLVIAIVVGISVAYPLLAFFPKMRAIEKVRAEIRLKQDFLSQVEKLRPVAAQQKSDMETTVTYVAEQRDRLVAPAELSRVFGIISRLARESGTVTTRFEPHAPIAHDSFGKVPVVFAVSGSTDSVQKLLERIERLPHALWLESVKLEAAGENSQTIRCNIDLAIFTDNREISD